MHPPDMVERNVEHAIRAGIPYPLERIAPGYWRTPGGDDRLNLLIRLAGDDWIELTGFIPLTPDYRNGPCWSLLQLNGRLEGSVRIVPADRSHESRADLLLSMPDDDREREDGTLVDRIRTFWEDLQQAHHCARIFDPVGLPETVGDANDQNDAERITRLCEDAAWPVTRRPGQILVSVGSTGTPFEACLSLTPGSRLRATVPLTTTPVVAEVSRSSIAMLLLDVSSRVRTVRAVARGFGPVELPALDAVSQGVSPPAIDRALTALAVACERAGREVQALQSESVAHDYLAIRRARTRDVNGWTPHMPEQEESTCLQLP